MGAVYPDDAPLGIPLSLRMHLRGMNRQTLRSNRVKGEIFFASFVAGLRVGTLWCTTSFRYGMSQSPVAKNMWIIANWNGQFFLLRFIPECDRSDPLDDVGKQYPVQVRVF